jgi:hypothetical protein
VLEETGVLARNLRELYEDARGKCFVASCDAEASARVGRDPELAADAQMIREVRWFALTEKRDDWQVAIVLAQMR